MSARRAAAAPRRAPAGSRCPRCGGAFGCAIGTGSCWCAGESLTSEHLEHLAAQFDGCLCPACLRELAHAQPGAAPLG